MSQTPTAAMVAAATPARRVVLARPHPTSQSSMEPRAPFMFRSRRPAARAAVRRQWRRCGEWRRRGQPHLRQCHVDGWREPCAGRDQTGGADGANGALPDSILVNRQQPALQSPVRRQARSPCSNPRSAAPPESSDTGTAGVAGNGVSILVVQDSAASSLKGVAQAYGGAGGGTVKPERRRRVATRPPRQTSRPTYLARR